MIKGLSYPFNRKWEGGNGAFALGGAWLDGRFHEGAELAGLFAGIGTFGEFEALLLRLNGHFAIVLDRNGLQAAAVDRLRSFPLLWRETADGFILLEDGRWRQEYRLDREAAQAFETLWCTPGSSTLAEGVSQIEAGHFLWKEPAGNLRYTAYYRHFNPEKFTGAEAEARKLACSHFERIADRAIALLAGRPAVVPLSGGYDSRLLLTLLARRGYGPLSAYTYGHPDSHEVRLAERVARELGVPWHFVPYDHEAFAPFFSEDWSGYSDNNHFLSSLPHEQDFFALHALRASNRLPESFVALPGFCGDLLGGSITAFPGGRPWDPEALERQIRNRYRLPAGVPTGLAAEGWQGRDGYYDAWQEWFVRHKVSKFIVNSVRVYEYFGGDWLLPLWDTELTNFWYGLPYAWRRGQRFYNEVLFEEYFAPAGVAWRKPGFDDNYPSRFKARLRPYVPRVLLKGYRWLKPEAQRDVNRLQVLAGMIADRQGRGKATGLEEFNRVHARYFLLNLNK